MGFFDKNAICGKKIGLNRYKIKKSNAWVCPDCVKAAGGFMKVDISKSTIEDLKNMINDNKVNKEKLSNFQITKEVGVYLKVDENKKEWYIPDVFFCNTKNPKIHSYDEILDFELLEDNDSIAKGGLGRAVVGSVLFGSVGAIAGAVTGKKKSNQTCTSLKIKVTLNNMNSPTEYINLITTECKKSGFTYKMCKKQAEEIMSLLQVMCEQNKTSQKNIFQQSQNINCHDEILRYKNLLDIGAITQE